jgi:hypothetical protein
MKKQSFLYFLLSLLWLIGCSTTPNNEEIVTVTSQTTEQILKACPTFQVQSVNCNQPMKTTETRRKSKAIIEKISDDEKSESEEQ